MKWNEWMNDQEQMTEGKMRTESNRLLEKKLLSWIKLLPSLYNWCVTVRQCHSVLKQRKSLKDKTTEKHMVRREKRVYVPSSVWLYLFRLFCCIFFCGRSGCHLVAGVTCFVCVICPANRKQAYLCRVKTRVTIPDWHDRSRQRRESNEEKNHNIL